MVSDLLSTPTGKLRQRWSNSISTPEGKRRETTYVCPNVFWKGMKYFTIHALVLVTVNSGTSILMNYFRGREVIPLKVAILSAGTMAGMHHLMLDGRACIEARDIRAEILLMGVEKLIAVGMAILLSPFITYGCANYLMKSKIKILPIVLLAGVGGTSLFVAETIK